MQQLQDTFFSLDARLKEALHKALDKDTFCITNKRVSDQELVSCTLVDQTGKHTSAAQLVSSWEARVIAIVDRTADIDAAAKAIVTARFSFQGMSPYAPDVVVVNEFVKKDFFQACTRYASQAFASHPPATLAPLHPSRVAQKAIKDAEEKGQLSSFGSSTFMLVDISERYCNPPTCQELVNHTQVLSCDNHENPRPIPPYNVLYQSH